MATGWWRGDARERMLWPPPSLLTPPTQPASPILGFFALILAVCLCLFLNLSLAVTISQYIFLSIYLSSIYLPTSSFLRLSCAPRLSLASFYLCACLS